jgi:hypothetical protein
LLRMWEWLIRWPVTGTLPQISHLRATLL